MLNSWITKAFGSAPSKVWRFIIVAAALVVSATAGAQQPNPQWWSLRNGGNYQIIPGFNAGYSSSLGALGATVTISTGARSSLVFGPDGSPYVGNMYWAAFPPSLDTRKKEQTPTGNQSFGSTPAVGTNGLVYAAYENQLGAFSSGGGGPGKLVWKASLGSYTDLTLSSPTIDTSGTVYIGSNSGTVYAFNGTTGAQLWSYATGGSIDGSPAVDQWGNVFVGSEDGCVYALNTFDGSLRWSYNTGKAVKASPLVVNLTGNLANESVDIGSTNGEFYVFFAWSGAVAEAVPSVGAIESSAAYYPVVGSPGVIVFGSDNGNVYALGARGFQWTYQTNEPITSSPAISADGVVYVNTSSQMFALNISNGKVVGGFEVETNEGACSPTIDIQGDVFFPNENGNTYIFKSTVTGPTFLGLSTGFGGSVFGGQSCTGTVVINNPAPAGGSVVNLWCTSDYASVPSSVTVPAGQTSTTFTVTTYIASAQQSATIIASGSNTFRLYTGLTINPSPIASMSLNPSTVIGGNTSTGTVTANYTTGYTVSLTSSNSSVTVPATVSIPAGSTQATFIVTTSAITSQKTATITASYSATSQSLSATLTVNPLLIQSIAFTPSSVTGGTNSSGSVTLSGSAPTGGVQISLAGGNTYIQVPSTVTVAAGSTTAAFTATTTAVSTRESASVSATSKSVGGTPTGTLTVLPAALQSISLNSANILGGKTVTGTVTLTGPAAAAAVVTLSSDQAAATPAKTVSIAAGSSSGTFTVTTTAVAAPTNATISGTLTGASQAATLTVNPPAVSSVVLSPSKLAGGTKATGTVTLGSAAPAGGLVVTLSSDKRAATVPATVTVPEGKLTITFTVGTNSVPAQLAATITASSNGGSQSATLTINPPKIKSITVTADTIYGGTSTTGTVTLTGSAPTAGLTITLSAGEAVSIPTSIVIVGGTAVGTFTITANPVSTLTTETVKAVLNGQTSVVTLDVLPPNLSSFALNPMDVTGGSPSTATLTLTGPAPSGGLAVSVSSSNKWASVPSATVTVPAGQTSTTFTVKTIAAKVKETATLTATLPLTLVVSTTLKQTLTIEPTPELVSVTISPSSIVGGGAPTVTVTVSIVVPKGGLTISLSSTGSVAVPSTVNIDAGLTTAIFSITTKKLLPRLPPQ